MDRTLLERKALTELREIASTLELRGYQRMKKADLVDLIIDTGSNGAVDRAVADAATGGGGPGGNGEVASPNGAPTAGGAGSSRQPETAASSDHATRVRARRRDRGDDASVPVDDPSEQTDRGGTQDRDQDRSAGATDRDPGDQDRSASARDRQGGQDGETKGGRGGDDTRDQGDAGSGDQGSNHQGGQGQGGQGQGGQGQGGQGGQGGGRNRSKRERRRKNRGGGSGQQQQQQSENLDEAEVREGVLDLLPEGYGFLRTSGYLSGTKDVYVSQAFVRRFDLRRGDRIAGPIRRNKNNDKFPALGRVDTLEGEPVNDNQQAPKRTEFKDLTPLFPDERLRLEVPEQSPLSVRMIDMMAPIGKGQRGLLVAPPKAGKTTVLKQLAASIEANNPEVHLMVVLVDERPEEVTDFKRSTKGEVISSTFDRPADDHTQVAELASERAKRLVERGQDVVILLDSITRLGRAYNLAAPVSGRILSGGIDSAALYPPKRFFGAARNCEEGGSLTIIASALIETGSKMDEVIFEEFKATGNMELRLDRRLEQKRIFPAIDVQASGTRREELLLQRAELEAIWKLRRLLSSVESSEASLQLLIDRLRKTDSNAQFLQMIAKSNLQ